MRIEVRARGFSAGDALLVHIERRLGFALDRTGASSAVVWLDDVNGGRGGVDKRCRVRLGGRRFGGVVVSGTAETWHAAVDEAAGRAGRAALRALDRGREVSP